MQTKGNAAGLKLIKLNEGRHSQTLRSHCLNDMILMLHNDPNEWHCGKWRVQCVWSLTPYNQLWITLSYIEFNGSFFNFSLERPHLHELNTKSMEFSFKQQTLTMASIVKRQIAQKHINQYRVQVMLLSWLRFSHKKGTCVFLCVHLCPGRSPASGWSAGARRWWEWGQTRGLLLAPGPLSPTGPETMWPVLSEHQRSTHTHRDKLKCVDIPA